MMLLPEQTKELMPHLTQHFNDLIVAIRNVHVVSKTSEPKQQQEFASGTDQA
jgi:hypothetical protein